MGGYFGGKDEGRAEDIAIMYEILKELAQFFKDRKAVFPDSCH